MQQYTEDLQRSIEARNAAYLAQFPNIGDSYTSPWFRSYTNRWYRRLYDNPVGRPGYDWSEPGDRIEVIEIRPSAFDGRAQFDWPTDEPRPWGVVVVTDRHWYIYDDLAKRMDNFDGPEMRDPVSQDERLDVWFDTQNEAVKYAELYLKGIIPGRDLPAANNGRYAK